jgi:hypothetical protein
MTSSKSSTDGLALPALCALSAVAIGYAVQLNNGAYGPEPLRYLTIGLGAALLAIAVPRFAMNRGAVVQTLAIAMGVASAFQIALIVGGPPGIYLRTAFWSDTEARFALVLGAVAIGLAAVGSRALQRGVVLVLFAVHVLLAIWTIKASPNPHIDVYTFHTEAFKALSLHKNPYAITMPNIYFSDALYGPGTTAAGRVLAGYLYPPLSLVMGWLANLFGDYRYANVFSTGVAGLFMAYARPGRLATSAAALYWFSPRILFVIEQG